MIISASTVYINRDIHTGINIDDIITFPTVDIDGIAAVGLGGTLRNS